jgi:hypothetical protein
MESTAPAKPAENFKAPEPQAEASATTENDVGAREEADILSERLHILDGQLGKPARELIDAHRKTIGAPNGAKRFGELTIAQCRALVQILENLTTA